MPEATGNTVDHMTHAERILLLDQYRRDFESANTRLTIQALPLSQGTATVPQLVMFIDAALDLASVCDQECSERSHIDVLFWLCRRLEAEIQTEGRSEVYLATCRREVKRVKELIQQACQRMGGGKLVALV